MKNRYVIAVLVLWGYLVELNAQTFNTQFLNKEPFLSQASLLQDYDNDGDLDIILTRAELFNQIPKGVYWLENDSTQQFEARSIITDDLPFYMADIDTADFDRDGHIDYVICFTDVDDGELAWFQRLGDRSYQKWTIATNKDYIMADVGDFNGDGYMDIVAVGVINSDQTCRVYINQQNLFFEEQIIGNDHIEAVDAADVDGDGDIDIVVAGSGLVGNELTEDGGSRLYLNDGEGNFTEGTWLISWTDTHAALGEDIEMIDFDQDGTKDILGIRGVATSELIFFDGSNGFQRNEFLEELDVNFTGDFVVFDIDNNGLLDIVRQDFEDLSVLYQVDNFVFEVETIDDNWDNCCNPTTKMSVGDLDNDGDLDLVFPEQGNIDEDVSWFENIDGKLYKHQIYSKNRGNRIVKLMDFDQDGDLDVFATVTGGQQLDASGDLTVGNTEDELIMYENLDGRNFVNWRLNDQLFYAADIEFADIDGDGDKDIFATARDADDVVWLRNDGFPANWVTDTIFPEANKPLGIAAGDLDNDDDEDLIVCSFGDDKVFGFRNNGEGSFSPFVLENDANAPREAEIADLDADGFQDVVVVSSAINNTVVVYYGDSTGEYTKQVLFFDRSARDVEIEDWDGNGSLDILVSLFDDDFTALENPVDVLLFRNEAKRSYSTVALASLEERTNGLLVLDVDEDEDKDLVLGFDGFSGNSSPPIITVGINEGGEIIDYIPLADQISGSVLGLDAGDVDNDNKVELVFAEFEAGNIGLINFNIERFSDTTVMDTTMADTTVTDTTVFDSTVTSIRSRIYPLVTKLSIYPNPASEELYIRSEDEQIIIDKVIWQNTLGQKMLEVPAHSKAIRVKLHSYPPGIYYLTVDTNKGRLSKKILLE